LKMSNPTNFQIANRIISSTFAAPMEVTTGPTKNFFCDKDNFATRNQNFMYNI
jgi:hypothetical protein